MSWSLRGYTNRVRGRTHLNFVDLLAGKRAVRWWLIVTAVGVASGLAGAAYVEVMRALIDLLGPNGHGRVVQLVILTAAGVFIAAYTRVAGRPGSVELLVDNIHLRGGRGDLRDLRTLIPVSLVGIGAGSAIGPEAPLVQTTGSIGSWVGERLRLEIADLRVLTITGMAAGFTVLFGAPLGAALFALEILHRRGLEYYEALLPAAMGSVSGWAVYAVVTGLGFDAVWRFPAVHGIDGSDMLVGIAAGVAAAVVATGFVLTSRGLQRAFGCVPVWLAPVLGGLGLGALAFVTPYALTFGEAQIQHVVSVQLAVGALLLAVAGKFVASAMITASGWRGGFIIPLFFMGAALGSVAAQVFGINEVVAMSCLMAGINVGVTKTPFGSTTVIAEMTGLAILPPVLVASLVSLFLTNRVSMIETQRRRSVAEPA